MGAHHPGAVGETQQCPRALFNVVAASVLAVQRRDAGHFTAQIPQLA